MQRRITQLVNNVLNALWVLQLYRTSILVVEVCKVTLIAAVLFGILRLPITMQSVQRRFGKLLPRTADESQVAVLLKDFDDADRMLGKVLPSLSFVFFPYLIQALDS